MIEAIFFCFSRGLFSFLSVSSLSAFSFQNLSKPRKFLFFTAAAVRLKILEFVNRRRQSTRRLAHLFTM
jgi:hypothetical protein